MSSDVAISLRGVSKNFHIYACPLDRLKQSLFRGRRTYYSEVRALEEVSFEVRRGETVGIVGRNGSGKSTLLQCICGTLTPSRGEIAVHGRVAALLELGAGFNPEFSGRENVYVNAALLGMERRDVEARFSGIAAFADIGDFLDRPVKTYSSGMFLRLAFAVMAHVRADILVIDEALAVGDVFFVQKCMRFLQEFRKTGTILFVSHDTSAVLALCERALWLKNGRVEAEGRAKSVCERYLAGIYGPAEPATESNMPQEAPEAAVSDFSTEDNPVAYAGLSVDQGFGEGGVELLQVSLRNESGRMLPSIQGGEMVRVVVRARALRTMSQPIVGFMCKDRLGQFLFGDNTWERYGEGFPVGCGQVLEAVFAFRMPILAPGDYSVAVAVAEGTQEEHVQHVWVHDALAFKSHSSSLATGLVGVPDRETHLMVTE
ncbi:ABC transporter ATP-binding protein [Desulfomicrobium orale]|uniref:ABC transporter ATP-binding protein n=1 Tax=Desulfomicrobium orale DSM 12838 TaxID=888061 RepID=A0A0X8JNS0_9BACT|nr:ABC transporter ATP-binding protein [Desulfomicrobium orale]AMD92096.1 ABC transporter ATP-binding protein [Desulfomicrobium orale DSM 12838]